MSGTDRLLVVTILGKTNNRLIPPATINRLSYHLQHGRYGLAGKEIDCATIHQSDTSTEVSAPLIEVLIIPLL